MERKDQMPAEGCGICGAYAGETQASLKKLLVFVDSAWICKDCVAMEEEA